MYIARNKYTGIRMFHHKPSREGDVWLSGLLKNDSGYCVDAETEEMFAHLKWENEPVKVKIVVPMEYYFNRL